MLISAKGAPQSLLWLWLEGSFKLISCPALLAELELASLNFEEEATSHETALSRRSRFACGTHLLVFEEDFCICRRLRVGFHSN